MATLPAPQLAFRKLDTCTYLHLFADSAWPTYTTKYEQGRLSVPVTNATSHFGGPAQVVPSTENS